MTDTSVTTEPKKTMKKKENYLAVYKANGKKTGAALQLRLHHTGECAFFEAAPQVGEVDSDKPYDWGKKLVVKLGDGDIGKLLHLFNSGGAALKLYHENAKGNKIVELKKQTGNYSGYYLTISAQAEGKNTRVGLPLSDDEVELMKLALGRAYLVMLGW